MTDPYWATEYRVGGEGRAEAHHTLRLVAPGPPWRPPGPRAGFRRVRVEEEVLPGGLVANYRVVDLEMTSPAAVR